MDKTRVLHLILILALLLLILFLFKLKTGREDTSPVPHPIGRQQTHVVTKQNKTRLPAYTAPEKRDERRFWFPSPLDRLYSPTPRVWERKRVELKLAQGNITVDPPRNLPLRKKQILTDSYRVILPWVFSLP